MLFIIIHAAEMKQSLPLAKVDPANHIQKMILPPRGCPYLSHLCVSYSRDTEKENHSTSINLLWGGLQDWFDISHGALRT